MSLIGGVNRVFKRLSITLILIAAMVYGMAALLHALGPDGTRQLTGMLRQTWWWFVGMRLGCYGLLYACWLPLIQRTPWYRKAPTNAIRDRLVQSRHVLMASLLGAESVLIVITLVTDRFATS